MLNYVTYLRNKDQYSIVKQSLLTSIDLHSHVKSSFYSNLINSYHYYDLHDFNISTLDNHMIKRHLDTMKTRYIDHWRHTLQHSKKLEFYSSFKNNFAPSIYLDITRKNCNRKTLVKLRIGNHKLGIETGRYDNNPRCERLCSLCDINEIEDEIHFLFRCSKYSTIRNAFYNKIGKNRFPNVKQLQLTDLIFDLMNCNDNIIKFVSLCFDLRNKFLSGL